MGLYKELATNENLELGGVWVNIGDHTCIRVARASVRNQRYMQEMDKISRENKRTLDMMSEAQGRRLLSKVYAETIVKDWLQLRSDGTLDECGRTVGSDFTGNRYVRGIENREEEILEFNTKNIMQAFEDLPELLVTVRETSEDGSLYRQKLLDSIAGN